MESHILLVGNDDGLQLTRAAILNQRWSACLARPNDAMRSLEAEQPDLLILCHTLCRDEAQALVRACRDKFPNARILALEVSSGSARELKADAVVETLLGPQPMVSAIEMLLRNRSTLGQIEGPTNKAGPGRMLGNQCSSTRRLC
jgi:DNA-binding response OmpR family regulator